MFFKQFSLNILSVQLANKHVIGNELKLHLWQKPVWTPAVPVKSMSICFNGELSWERRDAFP